jgi:hypothetical protein
VAEPVQNWSASALPEPLGAQLVNRGLITDEQLAVALDEQRASGGQIGAILVKRGFVTPAVVAQALAVQAGSLLENGVRPSRWEPRRQASRCGRVITAGPPASEKDRAAAARSRVASGETCASPEA